MRIRYLTCFIIVFFTQVISIFGLHGNFSSEQKGLNSSNNNIQTKQSISRTYENIKDGIKFHKKGEQYNKEEKFEQDYELIKKANRGKGGNGGANVNYRSDPRRSRKSASSFLSRISTVCVSFVLLLVFSFHAKLL